MESCDTSCEPMDVDLSINSGSDKDLQDSEPLIMDINIPRAHEWHFKKFHINKKPEKKSNPLYKIISTFLVVCVGVFLFNILSLRCTEELDLKDISDKLARKLHDQSDAITNLLDDLSMDTSKILFMYGGTGVGKTFTISMLLENIWNSSNVYHYTMPSIVDIFSIDKMFGLSICKTSIVVVDDLKPSDLVFIKELINNLIKKSVELKKKITVILVFNCDVISRDLVKKCDSEFPFDLEKNFKNLNLYKKLIRYEPLTENTLKKCIQDEIGSWNIDEQQINNLLNNFNVSLDGCKGVHKKIKYLNSL